MDKRDDNHAPGDAGVDPSRDGAHVDNIGAAVPQSIEGGEGRLNGNKLRDQPADEEGYTDLVAEVERSSGNKEELTHSAPEMDADSSAVRDAHIRDTAGLQNGKWYLTSSMESCKWNVKCQNVAQHA